MNDLYRRLTKVELSLSPEQIVLLWLKNAQGSGTFFDAARGVPFPRKVPANRTLRSVESSMKGHSDQEIERAILQARQQADFLYLLVVDANTAVIQSTSDRRREAQMLRYHFLSLERAPRNKESVEELRSATLLLVEEALVVEGALAQLSAEYFGGQTVLFSDTSLRLESQIDLANLIAAWFNLIAQETGAPQLSLEALRDNLGPKVAKKVAEWVDHSSLAMLMAFGDENTFREAFNQIVPKLEEPTAPGVSTTRL